MDTGLNLDRITANYGIAVPWAYGTHVCGGNVILRDDTDLSHPVIFIGLGEGEWDGVVSIGGVPQVQLNGSLLGAGEFHFHPGVDGQESTGGGLVPESEGGDNKVDLWFPGVQPLTFSRLAYMALRFDSAIVNPDGIDFRALMKCRKVQWYDVNGAPAACEWTENPARQMLDVLRLGYGLPVSRMNMTEFLAAEADADHDLGGGKKRFVSHVAVTDKADLDTIVRAICDVCRGVVTWDGAQVGFRIDLEREVAYSFSAWTGTIVDGSWTHRQRDVGGAANRLNMVFRDTENNWAEVSRPWDHEAEQARIGRILPVDPYRLPPMPQDQGGRLANYLLTRNIDLNEEASLGATPAAFAVLPGDVVDVEMPEAPWPLNEAETFEIEAVELKPDHTLAVDLVLYRDETYSDEAGAAQNLEATTINKHWAGPGGGGGTYGDEDVPPAPDLNVTIGDGAVALGPLSFTPTTNAHGISALTACVAYMPNDAPVYTELTGDIDADDMILPLVPPEGATEDGWVVIGDEIIATGALGESTVEVLARGWLDSTPAGHLTGARVEWIRSLLVIPYSFPPQFFLDAANCAGWRQQIDLPDVRVAAIYAVGRNAFGEGPAQFQRFTS